MLDLPQVTVPVLLFDMMISGLVCAATWHAINIAGHFLKQIRTDRD